MHIKTLFHLFLINLSCLFTHYCVTSTVFLFPQWQSCLGTNNNAYCDELFGWEGKSYPSPTTLQNLINACQLRRDESLITEKNMSPVVSYIPLLKLGHFLQWDCIVHSPDIISHQPKMLYIQSVPCLSGLSLGGCSSSLSLSSLLI